jgi:hypothetical protein
MYDALTQYDCSCRKLPVAYLVEPYARVVRHLAQISSVKDLKKHLVTLQQEVHQEQLKSQALAEVVLEAKHCIASVGSHVSSACVVPQQELERPVNVHRWRRLESSNPELYDLITRVHKLQRRLLECNDNIVERDSIIKQREALYSELKLALSRQPDSEVAQACSWLLFHSSVSTADACLSSFL